MTDTKKGMDWIIEMLRKDQSPNGSWDYPFETGISTDAYMIILLRTLEIHDEELIQGLTKRLISKQEENGAWKLFYDEGDGNLTATVEAYYGLLYSGYYTKNDKRLVAAKRFILANGGLEQVGMFTKVMLAITGQYTWPSYSLLPIELILLPLHFPINFYSFSVFGRANLTPIMILADNQFTIKTDKSPDLSDLQLNREAENHWDHTDDYRSLYSFIKDGVESLIGITKQLNQLEIERDKKYIIDQLEPDGTIYS
jgi:sporulenol synthase